MLKLVHDLLALLLGLTLLHFLGFLLLGLGSQELLLKIVCPTHSILNEGGQDKQGDQALQQSDVPNNLEM